MEFLSEYASFFHMTIPNQLLDSIYDHYGKQVLEQMDVSHPECMYIPSALQPNMTLLLLSDMPCWMETHRNHPLTMEEVRFLMIIHYR